MARAELAFDHGQSLLLQPAGFGHLALTPVKHGQIGEAPSDLRVIRLESPLQERKRPLVGELSLTRSILGPVDQGKVDQIDPKASRIAAGNLVQADRFFIERLGTVIAAGTPVGLRQLGKGRDQHHALARMLHPSESECLFEGR
jgi:hypothetical protein